MRRKGLAFLVLAGILGSFCRLSVCGLPLPSLSFPSPTATTRPVTPTRFSPTTPAPTITPTLTYPQQITSFFHSLIASEKPFELTFGARSVWSMRPRGTGDPHNVEATNKVINVFYIAFRNQLLSEIRHEVGPEAARFLHERLTGIAEGQPGRTILAEIHVEGEQHLCIRRDNEDWKCTQFLQSATAPHTTFFHFLVLPQSVFLEPEAIQLDHFTNPLLRIQAQRDTDEFTEEWGAHVWGTLYRLPGWRWTAIQVDFQALASPDLESGSP